MRVLLANPRGFCAGVDRAIDIVERALEVFKEKIYVRHEVVHNRHVVDGLRRRGAVFVRELDEVPDDAVVIFSAHGVASSVREEAQRRRIKVLDATCPLVTKVHVEVMKYSREGREVILVGHAGHPEVIGTMGQYDKACGGGVILVESVADVDALEVKNPRHLAYVTQTTLSVDDTQEITAALKRRFPDIASPRKEDICYATQNRQEAVKQLTKICDLILIVGSPNSSNSNRLCEIAMRNQVATHLIDDDRAIDPSWLRDKKCVGVSAGASAPEALVQQVIAKLRQCGATQVSEQAGVPESVVFSLPVELRSGKAVST